MAEFPQYRICVTRPVRVMAGAETRVEYRVITREVACEIYPTGAHPRTALPGTLAALHAQAIVPLKADIRYGDRLVEPSGKTWDVEDIIRTDILCRCALRAVGG